MTPATRPVVAQERRNGACPHCVSWGVGFLMGALVCVLVTFDRLNGGNDAPPVIAAPNQAGTMVVNVDAELHLPPATATTPPTPRPTDAPTADAHADDCDRVTPVPKPGSVCRKPPAPTATPPPPLPCPTAAAGTVCVWTDPLTSNREVTG